MEIFGLEECNLRDRARDTVQTEGAGVRCRWQRNAGVADRVRPARHARCIGNRHVKQLVDAQFLSRLREGRIDPFGVLPDQVHLVRVGAKLPRPLDPGEVADQEPALLVFQPQTAAVMVLERGSAINKLVDGAGNLVHVSARTHIVWRVATPGVAGNYDAPWLDLGLRKGKSLRRGFLTNRLCGQWTADQLCAQFLAHPYVDLS